MLSQAKTPTAEELFLNIVSKLNTTLTSVERQEEKLSTSDPAKKGTSPERLSSLEPQLQSILENAVSAGVLNPGISEDKVTSSNTLSILEKIPADTLSELVEEAEEKALDDAIDKARKIPNSELDQIIQNLIDKKFSKQLIYHALQKIFDDELRRGASCLFYQGDEAAIEGRLEFLEETLIKHFGFSGFITGYFITVIAFEGGREDYFNALKVLCLCKTMLEKFPDHESLKCMNEYWTSAVKSTFLEMKADKAYLAGESIDKMLEDFSKKTYSDPEQSIEKAKKEAEKILVTIGLLPQEGLGKKTSIHDIKLLTAFTKKKEKEVKAERDFFTGLTYDGSYWTPTQSSPTFFHEKLSPKPKSLSKSSSEANIEKMKVKIEGFSPRSV